MYDSEIELIEQSTRAHLRIKETRAWKIFHSNFSDVVPRLIDASCATELHTRGIWHLLQKTLIVEAAGKLVVLFNIQSKDSTRDPCSDEAENEDGCGNVAELQKHV
jgi:hypothetical protein